MHKSVDIRGEQLADDPKLLDENRDIFTRLVAAKDEKAKYHLDESEVVSKQGQFQITQMSNSFCR
jgi:hypothetical protein